jgi:hypothetical protein
VADRVFAMKEGRIVEGPPEGLAAEARLAELSAVERDALAMAALKAGLGPPP